MKCNLKYIFLQFIYYNWQDFDCNHWRIFNLHSTSVTHLRSWLCSFCRWDIPGTLNYRSLSTPRTFQLKNTTFFQERNNWKVTPGKFWLVPGKPAWPHHIDCQGSSGIKLIMLCLKKGSFYSKNSKATLWTMISKFIMNYIREKYDFKS